MTKIHSKILALLFVLFIPLSLISQVQLRDSLLSWQHHSFQLNTDFSMDTYTTNDADIQQVQYNAKVLENDLIRLVVIPEYGARVLSFVYKPTNHEYLYQSECGSPYGINEGNFYYNWLMVYGGIFPTLPESEHGKTWLKEWEYTIVKNTVDTVIIGMEYNDSTSYANAPGKFNNGITNITCRIEIGVYSGCSIWDFKVSLENTKNETVAYEYWTCTTLTPGSETGDTRSPLNSEMVVPITQYEAAWSPGSWIGSYGSLYDYSDINFLNEWDDMGIAYANNLSDNYWGVINHDNEEGIFRVSENIETPGMKFWTWGKNNVDNNLFDFSNGGADNYIELWAGVSEAFFTDTYLSAFEEKTWVESYGPTTGLTSISEINRDAAVHIGHKEDTRELFYELQAFRPNLDYRITMFLSGDASYQIFDKMITADELGNTEFISPDNITTGNYTLHFDVYDDNDDLILSATEAVSLIAASIEDQWTDNHNISNIQIRTLSDRTINISMKEHDLYRLNVFNISGQLIYDASFNGTNYDISLPATGLYIINLKSQNSTINKKVIIK